MQEQITSKSFREKKTRELDTVKEWVDKHYELIWDLMKDAQIISDEPFRVETLYGDISFLPKIKV